MKLMSTLELCLKKRIEFKQEAPKIVQRGKKPNVTMMQDWKEALFIFHQFTRLWSVKIDQYILLVLNKKRIHIYTGQVLPVQAELRKQCNCPKCKKSR